MQVLIRSNILVIRPTAKGGIEVTPDTDPYEIKIPPNPGIPHQ